MQIVFLGGKILLEAQNRYQSLHLHQKLIKLQILNGFLC